MKVYALVGPSGTGKSSQALTVAHRWQIPAIIDDGLLIYRGRKVAGYSAKYEQTTVAAVKRAVFHDPAHRQEVRESLRKLPVSKVLILGTSRRMVDRIARELGLPPVERYIAIEEVCPAHEIRKAQFVRRTQGKHAIPIPQIQVEKDLWGKLIASVEKIFSPKKEPIGERTIVRPPFQRGEIKVYESALKKLVFLSVRRFAPALTIMKTDVRLDPVASVSLTVTVRIAWGESIPVVVKNVQRAVYEDFLAYLDVELQEVNVQVQRLLLTSRNVPTSAENERPVR
ncbi:hypothetical protein BSNK01_06890 [Bacillaceae bacterium]